MSNEPQKIPHPEGRESRPNLIDARGNVISAPLGTGPRPHLDSHAEKLLSAPLAERLESIDAEIYIGSEFADAAVDRIMQLYRMPSSPRRPSMVLCGAPGMGKTHLFMEAADRLGLNYKKEEGIRSIEGVFVFHFGGIATHKDWFVRLYSTMKIPHPKNPCVLSVCDLLLSRKIRLLVHEEAADLHQLTAAQNRSLVLSDIRTMATLTSRPLIIMGSEEVKSVTDEDRHLHSRFGRPYELLPFSDPEKLREFLFALLAHLPFPEPSRILDDQTLLEVIRMSRGNTERICKSIRAAARAAMLKGELSVSAGRLHNALLEWQDAR